MPCKSLPCWQIKATLQGEHMLLTSINHSTLGCLSKVIYCRLRCTFVTVVALAENTQHILGVFKNNKVQCFGAHTRCAAFSCTFNILTCHADQSSEHVVSSPTPNFEHALWAL